MTIGNIEEKGNDMLPNRTLDTSTVFNITKITLQAAAVATDSLATLLAQRDMKVRIDKYDVLTFIAGNDTLSVPPNLSDALNLFPRATDILDPLLRFRIYAAGVIINRAERPSLGMDVDSQYIPLQVRLGKSPINQHFTQWISQPNATPQAQKLNDVSDALAEQPAFVLLGVPGAGKTTTLHKLEMNAARQFLTGQSVRIPLLINLADYQWEQLDPFAFISRQWQLKLSSSFLDAVRAGQAFLLLDGLSEMRRLESNQAQHKRAKGWERFLRDYFSSRHSSNRAVIVSRTNDYESTLDIPRVEINMLDDEQIFEFLKNYLNRGANDVYQTIQHLGLMDLARVPYMLSILADLYSLKKNNLPINQGRLFDEYINNILEHEDNFADIPPYATRLALDQLGYQMQALGDGYVLPSKAIEDVLPTSVRDPHFRKIVLTPPATVLEIAQHANLLQRDLVNPAECNYKFTHQFLQAQFAATYILRRWQSGETLNHLWQNPHLKNEMPPPNVGKWDPLPPPPTNGWEQSIIMAAGLLERADQFLLTILPHNPVLAGRCTIEGMANIGQNTRAEIQRALLADLINPVNHRRARLQAGRILAKVGDPRFRPQDVNGTPIIFPEWVDIPAGNAKIGRKKSDLQAYENEHPEHTVRVSAFKMAKYPITNAEYRCFVDAGGYNSKQYWTSTGWQWRNGNMVSNGPVEQFMETFDLFKQNPDALELGARDGWLTPDEVDNWRTYIEWNADEARQQAELVWGNGQEVHFQPYFWDNETYNIPNQPVVGVTWYEAMAYCVWLDEQLKSKYPKIEPHVVRLPTEAEWEWAAGGKVHQNYPWGNDFNADKANTLGDRVMCTSPVGAYPAGEGVQDLGGNVWEWTHSLFQPYPIRMDDGRENLHAAGKRALRGGSWVSVDPRYARISARDLDHPVVFSYDIGFRVILAPEIVTVP